jgi:hypothetical protein
VERTIYERVLFAWSAIGAAFGPLLIARLTEMTCGYKIKTLAMLSGFGLTLVFFWQPNSPGDYLERLVPFFVAMGLLLVDCLIKRNANQA